MKVIFGGLGWKPTRRSCALVVKTKRPCRPTEILRTPIVNYLQVHQWVGAMVDVSKSIYKRSSNADCAVKGAFDPAKITKSVEVLSLILSEFIVRKRFALKQIR